MERCPNCKEEFVKRICWEPGNGEVGNFKNAHIELLCRTCESIKIIPLSISDLKELDSDILYTPAFPEGMVMKLSRRLVIGTGRQGE